MKINRREFVKIGSLATSGLVLQGNSLAKGIANDSSFATKDELLSLSFELLQSWCRGLIRLQMKDSHFHSINGGIFCPACSRIHGRIGDTVYPFLFLAEKLNDQSYLDAAIKTYDWTENNVSMPNGLWYNDVNVSQWSGTTIFGAISLAEALIHHGHILDKKVYDAWMKRLGNAARYIYEDYDLSQTNINYHVSAAYSMALIGSFFDNKNFKKRGKNLAMESMKYFSPNDMFLVGEGRPRDKVSPKGSWHVDLGYNVEESLPILAMYARHTQDEEVLEPLLASLRTHAEFLLPDGAWDNSWGTRNYKWTYWGSRTTDGCQPAYALMADHEPAFYKVALENTKLLKKCTSGDLLYGGIHYLEHKLNPCVHHSFCHTKAMATILENQDYVENLALPEKITLPREKEYGVKAFPDINTWLVSKGDWRATVTGFDINFHDRIGGHASGGALTLLWHKSVGPLIAASTLTETMWEPGNMQKNMDKVQMPLTPRFELIQNDEFFSNICDFKAQINPSENNKILFNTKSSLVDIAQNKLEGTSVDCELNYEFNGNEVIISGRHNDTQNRKVEFVLPLIASNEEKMEVISDRQIQVDKNGVKVVVESSVPMEVFQDPSQERVFNFVPGMQALPIKINSKQFELKIAVI